MSVGRARAAVWCSFALLAACDPRVTSLGWQRPDLGAERDAAASDAGAPAADGGIYIEAESAELSAGFHTASDSSASGGQYLAPPDGEQSDAMPGDARASYSFEIARAGSYVVWGRIRGPDADHNRFWSQLDGGGWHKWRISTGDAWFWDALHDDTDYGNALHFELDAGRHELLIAGCVDGVALDRLYISVPGDMPPGNDTPCSPPHSIERDGACLASCGSHGMTTCGTQECQGLTAFYAYDCPVCCVLAP